MSLQIFPIAEEHIHGFHAAVDVFARERKYWPSGRLIQTRSRSTGASASRSTVCIRPRFASRAATKISIRWRFSGIWVRRAYDTVPCERLLARSGIDAAGRQIDSSDLRCRFVGVRRLAPRLCWVAGLLLPRNGMRCDGRERGCRDREKAREPHLF